MAFEIPLESDRVDDLNFFATVWRAPIIGTIFWILGGNKTKKEEESDETVDNDSDVRALVDLDRKPTDCEMKRSFSKRSALKKNTPSLADSEISEIADVGESLEGLSLSSSCRNGQRKKELSWSDESGKDLAEVIDESSNARAVIQDLPSAGGEHPQRVAAAMPRTMSVRNGKLDQSVRAEVEHHRRTLFDRQFSQTEPFPGAPDNESPQWGWYINTTPPTPDMYYASRPYKATRRENSDQTALTAQSSDSASTIISSSQSPGAAVFTMPKYHPNPVFREMQDKNKSVPMDWPTVPL